MQPSDALALMQQVSRGLDLLFVLPVALVVMKFLARAL